MRISAGTIARTLILLLALTNQILVTAGKSQIIIQDEQITETVSLLFTIGASVLAWWKNNSFTRNAIKADEYKEMLKYDTGEDESSEHSGEDFYLEPAEKWDGDSNE